MEVRHYINAAGNITTTLNERFDVYSIYPTHSKNNVQNFSRICNEIILHFELHIP